ncbi:MAG: choice-of-anchor D domain-containing protein [Myxococcaceae bacterium]
MRGPFAVLGLWALALVCGCADRPRSQPVDGRLMVMGERDFGTVVVDHSREHELTFRNVGKGGVRLLEVWTLGPERTFEAQFLPGPRLLVPGDQATVRVRFTPRGGGPQVAEVGLLTDSQLEQVFRVQVRGDGIAGAALFPTGVMEFGRIEAQSQKRLTLPIENPGPIAVEVLPKVLGADQDELELVPGGPFTLQPGGRQELAVTFGPQRVGRKQLALAIAPCDTCLDEIVPVAAEALEQAVVAEPGGLDFGQVPVDRDQTETVFLHNLSTEPMQVNRLELAGSSDPSFSLGLGQFPLLLGPGELRPFVVRYSPGHMGHAIGRLAFQVESLRHPSTDVFLHAFGGAAELCASPLSIEFGERAVGSKNPVTVNLKSCGASNALPAIVSRVGVAPVPGVPGADQFTLGPIALPRSLSAGEELSVQLFYSPTFEGAAQAEILLESDAFSAQRVRLPVSGIGQMHAPCDLVVTPGVVEFGTVRTAVGAVLGIKVWNRGADLCPVSVAMQDDANGAFWLPGGETGGVMFPGDAFSFMVAFRTTVPGEFAGSVKIAQGGPGLPVRTVPLRGTTGESCVVATPNYLDFGTARPDCPVPSRSTHLENVCPAPVVVHSLTIGPGTTDGEFVLHPIAQTLPLTLGPGQAMRAEVSYLGQAPGMNLSPLFVDASGLTAPLLVFLQGGSNPQMTQTDLFTQQEGNKLDVLFVVDNTASMLEEQPRLVAALPAFADEALTRGLDLQAAITTTGLEVVGGSCPGGALGGEAGRLFPVNGARPRILTTSMPNLGTALQANAGVGLCAFVEKGLEAARRALTPPLVDGADDPRTSAPNDGNLGFLRPEAALAVVFVGDEDDHSPDDVDSYVRFFRALKGSSQAHRVALFAIAPTDLACPTAGGTGTRYGEAARKTGGEVLSSCAADYAPFLRTLAGSAVGPQDRFSLSEVPDPSTLEVTLDGVLTFAYSYDAARNEVVFLTRPPGGTLVRVSYRRICQ